MAEDPVVVGVAVNDVRTTVAFDEVVAVVAEDGVDPEATADGVVTEDELSYVQTVSEAFGFTEATFRRIKASHLSVKKRPS